MALSPTRVSSSHLIYKLYKQTDNSPNVTRKIISQAPAASMYNKKSKKEQHPHFTNNFSLFRVGGIS